MSEPKSILRNRDEVKPTSPQSERLDRQEVIRNTRLNAKLSESEQTKGDIIRSKIAAQKSQHDDDSNYPDHLKWDEVNLYKTEQEKAATMKIDEPKTPYEGGFDPTGEYYQEDEEIPDFQLGEGAVADTQSQSLGGAEIVKDDDYVSEEEPESKPLTAEEKHKRFEEMRKKHYHLKGNVLGKKIEISDDEE